MKKITFLITLGILLFQINCATYEYSLENYKKPVYFNNIENTEGSTRSFRIEAKMTWLIFDLWNVQEFNLTKELNRQLPNAKKIYNLRIQSEEGPLDSFFRLLGTGAQIWAFVSNRPLFSRRTIIITGEVVE